MPLRRLMKTIVGHHPQGSRNRGGAGTGEEREEGLQGKARLRSSDPTVRGKSKFILRKSPAVTIRGNRTCDSVTDTTEASCCHKPCN